MTGRMKPPPPRLAPGEEIFDDRSVTFTRPAARRPAGPHQPPATIDEAEQRYWARYGMALVEALLGPQAKPQTIDDWYDLALATRAVLAEGTRERLARQLEAAADLLRWGHD